MSRSRLLVVDDDDGLRHSLVDWLQSEGYHVEEASGYMEAMQSLRQRSYDLILSDISLADGDGLDLLEQCQRNWPGIQVLLMTGYGTADAAVTAIRAGAFDYLTKPIIDDELKMAIDRALSAREVLRENNNLKDQLQRVQGLNNVVGRSAAMNQIFDVVHSVADTRATILITGESGTGKSMIARAIHRQSERSKGPFVEVACGALPENLLESELFGHVAGAFTGAATDKIGKFAQADGGTIFLDEIGTASLAMQVKLLRVLQELKFEKVGGNQTYDVDVRVVLATNEDLAQAVAEGRFRQDLFYRINVINLELPPLRGRVTDIPLLAASFLTKAAEECSRPIRGFSEETLAVLQNYNWPGNVRELQNVVERAALLGRSEMIELEDLPSEVRQGESPASIASPGALVAGKTLKEALEEPERQIILEVLRANGWSRNATADQLGINRTTLYKKMKKLGLEDGTNPLVM